MDFTTWQGLLQFFVTLVVGLLGVPVIQAIKNYFKLEDKMATMLAAVIAGGLALAELFLSGQVSYLDFTFVNIPTLFGLIFTVATIYYNLMKNVPNVLGAKFMVREP